MTPPPGKSRYLRRQYLAPTERVLFETHPSKWFFFPWPLLALGLSLLLSYVLATGLYRQLPALPLLTSLVLGLPAHPTLSGLTALEILFGLSLVLSGACAVVIGGRIVDWVGDTYVVTDDRVIEQKGIVRHLFQEIPLRQIRDVDVHQETYKARFLNYGTLRLKSLAELEMSDAVLNPSEATFSRSGGRILPKAAFPSVELLKIFDPRDPAAKTSGVEWWVGVPEPLTIERKIEEAMRASTREPAVAPPPASMR